MFKFFGATPDEGSSAAGSVSEPAAGSASVIGKIEVVTGACALTRADGVVIEIKVGDTVSQGDIIETAADGRIGIRFIDGTVFSLNNSARIALKEFASKGGTPSALFEVTRGTFAFVAGEMANAGHLGIDTPVASIRGRTRTGGVGMLTLAGLIFAVMEEAHAESSDDAFLDDGTITYNGVFELVTKEAVPRHFLVDNPAESVVLHRIGSAVSADQIINSDAQMAQLQAAQQEALHVFALGLAQGPTITGPSGSGAAPIFETAPFVQPINYVPPDNVIPPPHFIPNGIGGPVTFAELIYIPPVTPTIVIATPIVTNNIGPANTLNASLANHGFNINGTTSGIENGQTVTVTIVNDNSNNIVDTFSATVSANTWSVQVSPTIAKALGDGNYTVTANVSDAEGIPAPPVSQNLFVDQTVAAPGVALDADTGKSGSDGITNNGQVDVALASDVASWQYSIDGGEHWTAGSGTSFTLSPNVYAAGLVQVQQTDIAGNVSAVASLGAITVDATVAAPGVALDADTGKSGSDGITNNGQVDVALASDVASWQYSMDGGAHWTAGSGTSFTLSPNVYAAGLVQVQQTDIAGNVSAVASLGAITVDATVAAPGVALDADTGKSGSDGITNNGQVDVTLASDVASWQFSIDGGEHWTTGSGTSFTLSPNVYAAGLVQVQQTDIAGNVSAVASLGAITVDATVAAPGVALDADTGKSGSDGITNNGQVDVALASDVASWQYSIGRRRALDGGQRHELHAVAERLRRRPRAGSADRHCRQRERRGEPGRDHGGCDGGGAGRGAGRRHRQERQRRHYQQRPGRRDAGERRGELAVQHRRRRALDGGQRHELHAVAERLRRRRSCRFSRPTLPAT